MRIRYSLSTDGSSLQVCLFGVSAPVYSPYIEEPLFYGEQGEASLGTVTYPLPTGELLPPLVLIEPLDDPTTAERRYGVVGGYRYVGQILLPGDRLGEQVDVSLTRETLLVWKVWLAHCPAHQRAQAQRQKEIALLFRLRRTDIPRGRQRSVEDAQRRLAATRNRLRCADPQQRLAALDQIAGEASTVLPVRSLFTCLNDPSQQVRERAVSLLATAPTLLPVGHLREIAYQADLPARLAALHLLGKTRSDDAETTLLATRWRRHPWERVASLEGLVETDQFRGDVVSALCTALRKDEIPSVRMAAAHLLGRLGDPEGVEALRASVTEEREEEVKRAVQEALLLLVHE